ncbi:MAG: hypothetical protein ACAI43_22420 [Phycisphaerae bacterium]|nr:hypothetical protein [Tepidisphaeraceae bacterium]
MTLRFVPVLCGCLAVVAGAVVALAQPAATAPATLPAQGQMRVTITGVEGMVQVRESGDEPWKKAVVGMSVTEGAEFRTGPRSAVRCLIPPDQTITLDRLGVIKLMQALRDGNVVRTRVGMPYGRTRYDIEEAGIEHKSELVSPSSTLAVRGTRVSIFDQPPYAPSAVSLTGRAEYRTAKRQMAFGGKGAGKTEVSSDADSAAANSLTQTFVDPQSAYGRPEADQKLINQLQAKGDILLRGGDLAIATGGPVSDAQLQSILAGQGRFNISLRWTGPGDFDLFVLASSPPVTGTPYTLGNPSYGRSSIFKDVGVFGIDPLAPLPTSARSPDGGRIRFDQVALGGGGLEFASWGRKNEPVPQQGYTVGVLYYDQSGKIANYPTRSEFTVEAFLDGKRLPVFTNLLEVAFGLETELKFGPTYTGVASLIAAEQLLPSPVIPGDFRLTAVDITPEALDLAGNPIGNLNHAAAVAAARARAKALAAKPEPGARVVSGATLAARPAPAPVGPPATVAKPLPVGPRVTGQGGRGK